MHRASGKLLVFAAPTNEGNVGEIAYPARHHDEVFCIFSSSGAGISSSGINPTERGGGYNFAILGEDINTLGGERKSGTSFSTAIAAGLAGRLLDFSRQAKCKNRIQDAAMMKSKYGMTKILLAMSALDGIFRCLNPWELLPDFLRSQIPFDDTGLPSRVDKIKARDHVCTMVQLILTDAWRQR